MEEIGIYRHIKRIQKDERRQAWAKAGKLKFVKPKRISEANIQALISHKLRLKNIPHYLEYGIKGIGRFDIVILNATEKEIIVIVEVKSYIINRPPNINTIQAKRYKTCNVPLLYCGHIDQIDELIINITSLLT